MNIDRIAGPQRPLIRPIQPTARPESGAQFADQLRPTGGPPNPTLLIVDDEPGIGRAFSRIVKRKIPDLNVVLTISGSDAISRARNLGNNLVVVSVDEKMPGLDGHAVAAGIREFNPAVGIMMVCGQKPKPDANVDKVLIKMVENEDYLAAVREMRAKTAERGGSTQTV